MADPKVNENAPAAQQAPGVMPMSPEQIRMAEAAEQARINAEVVERDPMNGPDGGSYIVNGEKVDSEGKPIKSKKD